MDIEKDKSFIIYWFRTLGGGATLVGIVLGSITVFMIDRKFMHAAAFAAVGAVLTFFGLIHSDAVGFAMTPQVAAGYLLVAVALYAMSLYAKVEPQPAQVHHPHAMAGEDADAEEDAGSTLSPQPAE